MPYRICPKCQAQGRLLEAASQDAVVEYYRCNTCGHVWTRDKDHPDAPLADITQRPSKP